MARLSWRTSLGAQIQLGSLFSLLSLCTSLLSLSGTTTMAENKSWPACSSGGSAGLAVYISPLPSLHSQASNLLQLSLCYAERMKGKLFSLPLLCRGNWGSATLWLAQVYGRKVRYGALALCLESSVLGAYNLLRKESLFLQIRKRGQKWGLLRLFLTCFLLSNKRMSDISGMSQLCFPWLCWRNSWRTGTKVGDSFLSMEVRLLFTAAQILFSPNTPATYEWVNAASLWLVKYWALGCY